ncbi:MAG: toprim domain-containing protein [Victivallaceae bacterium]|nr:toprim domain-containing protein [Victivallaceae bacterium]
MPEETQLPREPESAAYNETSIETLSAFEHIRKRPGMYIGRMGDGSHPDDGIYILLKEIIDNAVDEFIMNCGKRIDVKLEDNVVSVRDYGRGIPPGKLVDCVSKMNTGGKYNDKVFQFSVGLNGVGTKAVNALSEMFLARTVRDGKFHEALFAHGVLQNEQEGECEEKNGTFISFTPDHQLFHDYCFKREYIERRLWMYAYLNSGLSIYFNDQRFFSRNGLQDLLESENGDNKLYEIISFRSRMIEFSLTHTDEYGEQNFSFVNGQFTNDGGTHLSAFKEGIVKAVNEFSGKNYKGDDVRDGLAGAIAVRIQEPIFESQTKNKLGNTDIRGPVVAAVRDALVDYLHKNKPVAEILLDKVARNEQMHRKIAEAKKQSKESSKKMALRIPKLKECKLHRGDKDRKGNPVQETMIFLTEGDSAAGSLEVCRDVSTQAVFALRGKPMNSYGEAFERIYKNEELTFLMQALGIETEIENLRYDKVIIATDADVDGMHIRNLLVTFFLSFFEEMVLTGHLFVLETPLFRVQKPKETALYCYSEAERDAAAARLGAKAEITRFKGLGEISPKEFGQFIGEEMKLQPVTLENMRHIPEILGFYMGQNTPQRRDYIMTNLELSEYE